ncbi:MAG: RluA family pseudouridine synthase [Candidatus Rhabdochlamydia sp.]
MLKKQQEKRDFKSRHPHKKGYGSKRFSRYLEEESLEQKFTVSKKEHGMTLLAFLRDNYKKPPSVKALKRWVEAKRCTVNGRLETFSTHPLKTGDKVVIIQMEEKKTIIKPVLLWEDEWLKAYDKPAGMVSDDPQLEGYLLHRLDKDTSGVILLGKSQFAIEKMIEVFRQKKIHKTYLAIVDGIVKLPQGEIVSHLAPKFRYEGQTVYHSAPQGMISETHWKKIASGDKASLVECHPITGRTHQLRVHMKEMRHPILGDHQYAAVFQSSYKPLRHLLHAYSVAFTHPITGLDVEVTADLPPDFTEALEILHMGEFGEPFSH